MNYKLTKPLMYGAIGVGLLATVTPAQAKKTDKRPNILFVLVDDQSPFDLKLYNPNSTLDTPTIDKLAQEGMVIDAARHMGSMNGAVSTPSRHMIMTGRSLWKLPSSAGSPCDKHNDSIALETKSMGAVFNQAGYKTMRTCKRGNSYEAANKQFSVVHEAVKRSGTEEGGSAWHAQRVLDYLDTRDENRDKEPFMIFLGFSHPHDVRNGTPELLAKYGATNHKDKDTYPEATSNVPLPINYLLKHPFHHGDVGLRDETRVSGVWERRDEVTIKNEVGREYACSENIDIQMAKVFARLEEMGELDNTYIIYTADHGISIGRHGLMGKQNLYEHTWRVPMIVKGPGIKAGSRVEGNVYLLDLLPTMCDLAGIEVPETVDGTSFKPLLMGQTTPMREVMYGCYCGGTKPGMRCVAKGDWKLIKYDVIDGYVRETQLFNLKENPNEFLAEHGKSGEMERNLAYDPKYAEIRKEMEALLLEQMIAVGDPFRFWDQPAL